MSAPDAFTSSLCGSLSRPTRQLCTQILEFGVFPHTSHTGENLKSWLLEVLKEKKIPLKVIAGITLDGAADGNKAIALIPEVRGKRDVCGLHQLQRAVLYSIGEAGAKNSCRNTTARDLLRQHARVVQLSHQSREIAHGFRDAQRAAKIPPHKYLSTVRKNATRWGYQKKQITRNNLDATYPGHGSLQVQKGARG